MAILFVVLLGVGARAQEGRALYGQIKAFSLTGGKADLNAFVFKRDRVEMTLTGTIYFSAPIDGKVMGAVFIGQGTFRAEVPPSDFEKANVKRLLGITDAIESDFKTAVFRFSDNTYDILGRAKTDGPAPPPAQAFALELDARILKETGANLSSRVAASILNHERPGVFFANFDGGKRGRFSYVYDAQGRLPTDYFEINGGERGLIFKYNPSNYENDVWMAFYSLGDYGRRAASYSDMYDLVDISNYDMAVDLGQPTKRLGLKARVEMKNRIPDLKAVTFTVGESLSEYEDTRLKKQMRVKSVRMNSVLLDFAQEDWESGFTIFMPSSINADQTIILDIELEGDFMRQPEARVGPYAPIASFENCSYPLSNASWYPRHGYLDRSTFSFAFTHSKKLKIASTGTRVSEQPDPSDKERVVTKYVMNYPVALQTFALGPFERHAAEIKWESGDKPTPLEFNSLPGNMRAIKEDFILAELNNSVRYFQFLFGKYPYESYGAVFHPYGFGQGFATMLTIPNTDRASKYTYAFLAHETGHQWWGNIVSWRSYRDQWLSEGFAEYSGVLYTGTRDSPKSAASLIDSMRNSLKEPPETEVGQGKGKLSDVGPLILGHRLETKKTYGAYSTLVYNKGALVLRMIHFLMTDPSTGEGKAFYAMMKDFVDRYRDKVASTDDFRNVVNEHFARSPIGKKYQLTDLNWFFHQWVYMSDLPSYHLDYQLQDQPDGTVLMTGSVTQKNAPDDWSMILPVVYNFGGKKVAYGTMAVSGAKTAFSFKLPSKPVSVELDPQRWVLSENTSTN